MKQCVNCKKSKEDIEFYSTRITCKICVNKRYRETYKKTKDKKLQKQRISYSLNKEPKTLYMKIYHSTTKGKEVLKKADKKWKLNNKPKIAAKLKKRRQTDIRYKIQTKLRSRLWKAINGQYKSGSAVRDLGCSIDEFKIYIESKFQLGMTWENWSYRGWHLDHIKPLSSFNLVIREELLKACHYTNLQPLWAQDNLKKSDKYDQVG